MEESTIWKVIDKFFQENPQALVKHHIDSYNEFYGEHIFQLLREMNPIKLEVDYDDTIQEFRSRCLMYLGGKDGSRVYFGKPVIHDSKQDTHYMYPNECRLRNMSYCVAIHYDVEIEYTRILRETDTPTTLDDQGYAVYSDMETKEAQSNGKVLKADYTPSELAKMRENTLNNLKTNVQMVKMRLDKMFLGRFPIMVQSKLCILDGMPRNMRYSLGECKNDVGGYFIIDGKEKVVIPQEAFGDNMLNIYRDKNDAYEYSADLKSVSENVSKPVRHMSVRILSSTPTLKRDNIGVFIPNAGNKPIPLFVVFRALGILTDKEIISYCLLQDDVPVQFVPYFEASIHDAANIITQYDAVKYISLLVKGRSISRTMHILADYFLPHVGEMNFIEKAYHLGFIVHRLLSVATGSEPETERDSYKHKRLLLIGPLMKNLFREYYAIQQKHIQKFFEHRFEFGKDTYSDLTHMIYRKYPEAFATRHVEEGFRKAFKGNWGAYDHTKIVGIVQDMNRLSHNGMISHLRKTNLPMDASVKLVGPRILHGSQWGIVDPIDTPDGGNVGLHKHLSIMTHVTSALSREPMIEWLKSHISLKMLYESYPVYLGSLTKLFVNGYWVGCIADPKSAVHIIKVHRRHGLIPITTSVMFDHSRNTVFICCDGGRLCRPIFYRDDYDGKFAFQKSEWKKIETTLMDKDDSRIWEKLISGFHTKEVDHFNPYKGVYYKWEELYKTTNKEEHMKHSKALLEYMDTQETEGSYIAMHYEHVQENQSYTHCEIHPSTTYGVMCNLINYLEHNPASRNSFSCGQSKQACSLYSTNYQMRMDKTAVVLNNGQIPLVKSRYLQYINNEENPYGENAIVAIMCYTGYNVEDAVLINEAALQRGLFRTTYYTTYEAHEEREIKNDVVMKDIAFGNVSQMDNVQGLRPDYDYSFLNAEGLIPENTPVDDRTVLIGESVLVNPTTNERRDCSKMPKKGQLGMVDKSFMTEGDAGQRVAKIRIREERIPTFGDKFASRAGQKGTVGMVIPEANMPYTKNGLRPDMIINPHALPSRMTIGQMIECIVGKACTMEGTAGECTAFYNKENKLGMFGELLTKHKFHSSGDEIMYDGYTGKQIEATVFIGPTYYMRLKHMVKDKINYRATGPMTKMTRQPVHGRANDGGLRIGEMERDAVISHGMSHFLRESMMDRADYFKLAICNKTGMVAVYNEAKDLMISPSADGPLQYSGSVEKDNQFEVKQITKHGRSFSIVHVPYCMKLLMQELQAIGVQLHLITDDNVNQMEQMKFSRNIDLCLGIPNATPQMVIEQVQSMLQTNKEPSVVINSTVSTPEGPPPGWQPESPEGPPPGWEEPIQSQEGGDEIPVFQTGGKVFYHGDIKPNRIWKILHPNEDGSYTIDTEDLDRIDVEKSVKVVEPKDIYTPGLFDYKTLDPTYHTHFGVQDDALYPDDYVPQHNPMPAEENPANKPMVNIIKIFNQGGQDYSVNDDSHTNNSESVIPGESNGNHPIIPIPTSASYEGPIDPPASNSASSGPIDFKNLVIKKEE